MTSFLKSDFGDMPTPAPVGKTVKNCSALTTKTHHPHLRGDNSFQGLIDSHPYQQHPHLRGENGLFRWLLLFVAPHHPHPRGENGQFDITTSDYYRTTPTRVWGKHTDAASRTREHRTTPRLWGKRACLGR